jgi:hypothetical protein
MYENKLSIDVLTLTTFLQEKDYYKIGIKVLLELIDQIQI